MSLVTKVQDFATRASTEIKSLRTLINGNLSDLSGLITTAKGNLVAAINEVKAQVNAAGDMLKSNYDSNADGKVNAADSADAAPWAGITGKPAAYPPAAHDASLVTSGVLDPARIPIIPSQMQVMSDGAIADLTAPKQGQIGQGTVVTTTDGRRWVYAGTGSKTLEASYVVLADVTPEWVSIANKPTTIAGYGITDAYSKTDIGDPNTDFVATFVAGLS